MARRRKEEQIPVSDTASIPQAQEAPARKRIVIPIRENGLDLSKLSPEDKQALQATLASDSPSQAVDPVIACMLIDAASNLEAAVLAGRTGLPRDAVARAVTPQEPLRSMLGDSLAKVASKHNLMGRWGDEIALAALLASWQAAAITAVRQLEAERRLAKAQEKQEKEPAVNVTA